MDSYGFPKTDDFQANEKNHPKTIILHKDEFGFGFTLRHFIVYPPSNLAPSNLTLYENEKTSVHLSEWKPDDQTKPMDTIFIREVKDGSPAHQAGLTKGDRIIAINNHPLVGKSYSDIIHLILESGNVLQLLVVPKEDDILQLYFASSAYEPVNRECKPECDSELNYLSSYDPPRKYLVKKKSRQRYLPKIQSEVEEKTHYSDFDTSLNYEFSDHDQSLSMPFDSYVDSPQSPHNELDRSPYFCNQSATEALISVGGTREDVQNRNDSLVDRHSVIAPSRHSFPDPRRYSGNLRAERSNFFSSGNGVTNTKDNPENISPINFVAQRRHQFESGSLLAESLERMQMYKSELSRMSKSSQCPIVSTHTAHFETLSSKTKVDSPEASWTTTSEPNYEVLSEECADLAALGVSEEKIVDFSSSSANEQVTYRQKGQTTFRPNKKLSKLIGGSKKLSVPLRLKPKSTTIYDGEEEYYLMRRVSYLRATADDQMYIELNHSNRNKSIGDTSKSEEPFQDDEHDDSEKDPSIQPAESKDNGCAGIPPEKANSLYGWVICKTVSFEGKRSSDRSWRHVWAILRNNMLYMLKERREPDNTSLASEEHAIDIACSIAKVATDYVKRKNVLRLSIINGTEFLIQTESHGNMLKWLKALQNLECEMKLPDWTSDTSVLKKAAAYEQRVMGHKTSAIAHQLSYPMKKLVFWYRSPTEHSSLMKARRSSHGDELALSRIGLMWCDRMVHSWKKVQNSVPEDVQIGASFGVRLELAPIGSYEHIPLLVELCIHVIEERGLDVVGIYRIPGNNAAVSVLTDVVNKGLDDVALQDPRWRDVNVVSSLLKAFFRKLPEPLLTTSLYPKFIFSSKTEDSHRRLTAIKNVLQELPIHHFETLKFLMHHLKKVVENSSINKMESRNLAIVFGPTLVRLSDHNMVTMVTDMSHQCHLIETMITFDKWLFQNGSPQAIHSPSLVQNFLKTEETKEESPQGFKPRTRSKQSMCKSKRSGIIEQDLDVFDYLTNEGASFDKESSAAASEFDGKDSESSPQTQNGAKPVLFTRGEERFLPTYNQLSNFANLKVKQFEMETKAMLKREGTSSVSSSKAGPMEWERIEKEWQKAKLELEEEDFLDRLADDPLFVSFLLSHPRDFASKEFIDKDDALAGPKRHSLNSMISDLEAEPSSINGTSKTFEILRSGSCDREPLPSSKSPMHFKSTDNSSSLKKSTSLNTFDSTPNVKLKDSYDSERILPNSMTKQSTKSQGTISSEYGYRSSKSAFKNSQIPGLQENKVLKIPSRAWKPSTSSIAEIGGSESGEYTSSIRKPDSFEKECEEPPKDASTVSEKLSTSSEPHL